MRGPTRFPSLLALATLATSAAAQVPTRAARVPGDAPPLASPSVRVVAGELAAGTTGMVLGAAVGMGVGAFVPRKGDQSYAKVGAIAGATLGAAGGVALVGSRGRASGSLLATTGGAAAGLAAAVVASKLGGGLAPGPHKRLQSVTLLLLPSLGATLGYNLSRTR